MFKQLLILLQTLGLEGEKFLLFRKISMHIENKVFNMHTYGQ